MKYSLTEKIGNPDLLVGREQAFNSFHKWIANMPKRLSKSWAILRRRKTVFVQRLFNELWSAKGEGQSHQKLSTCSFYTLSVLLIKGCRQLDK